MFGNRQSKILKEGDGIVRFLEDKKHIRPQTRLLYCENRRTGKSKVFEVREDSLFDSNGQRFNLEEGARVRVVENVIINVVSPVEVKEEERRAEERRSRPFCQRFTDFIKGTE